MSLSLLSFECSLSLPSPFLLSLPSSSLLLLGGSAAGTAAGDGGVASALTWLLLFQFLCLLLLGLP